MKTEDEYWIARLCNADTLPGTVGYVARMVVTLEETIEVYEQNEE